MRNDSKRVLVAEDNPGLAHVLQYNLEQEGLDVTVAHDGGEAWEFIQREKFDVVVTDHEMPRMSGIELGQRRNSAVRAAASLRRAERGRHGAV